MKKILFFAAITVFCMSSVNAQDGQTSKGKWLIEANTGFNTSGDEVGLLKHSANTGFGLSSVDGNTAWAIGAEGGYFIMDDLAVKLGLGYTDLDFATIFSYKVGAKYYVISKIPVQIDINGASIKDLDDNPLWLGLQAGYAIFLGEHISVEPGLRYSLSLNEEFTDIGIFEARIGFVLHF